MENVWEGKRFRNARERTQRALMRFRASILKNGSLQTMSELSAPRLLIVIVIAMAPSLAIELLHENHERNLGIDYAQKGIASIATTVAEEITQVEVNADEILDTLAILSMDDSTDIGNCSALADGIKRRFSRYMHIFIANPNGDVRCGDPSVPGTGLNVADRSYFLLALNDDSLAVGELAKDKISGALGIAFARALKNRNNDTLGVGVVSLNLDWVRTLLSNIPLPPDTDVFITDRDGIVVADTATPTRAGTRLVDAMSSRNGDGIVQRKGKSFIKVEKTLGTSDTRLFVCVYANEASVLETVNESNTKSLMGVMLGILIAIPLTVIGWNKVVRLPIKRLMDTAHKLKEGDLTARVCIGTKSPEFARLAGTMNAMASSLEEQHATSRAITAAIPGLVFVEDHALGTIKVNDGFVRYACVKGNGDSLKGDGWKKRVHPDDLAAYGAGGLTRAMFAGPFDAELRIMGTSGTYEWFQVRSVPDGTCHGLVYGVCIEITRTVEQRKEKERQSYELELQVEERTMALRQSQSRLVRAEKLEVIGQLTSGVAHDFNNLMQAILANIEMARINTNKGNTEKAVKLLENATNSIHRGASLTSHLLAFSRKQSLKPNCVLVSDILHDTRDMMQRMLGETIDIEINADSNLSHCMLDASQFQSAILNLGINARDAMPDGGTITMSAYNYYLDERTHPDIDAPSGHYVRVDVADTGVGIEPHLMEKVTQPFFTTKEFGKGTGLGLCQVVGFTHQSGGTTHLSSAKGKGTTVSLFFPVHHRGPDDRHETGVSQATHRISSGSILIVEDDCEVLNALEESFVEAGFIVTKALTGREALERLRQSRSINLVVSDVVLPGGMSGYALAGIAKTIRPDIVVLLTSGYAPDEFARHAKGQTFEMISKPYRMTELLDRVSRLMTGGGTLPQSLPDPENIKTL